MDDIKAFVVYIILTTLAYLNVEIELTILLGWAILLDTALGIVASFIDRDEELIKKCGKEKKWYERFIICYRLRLGEFRIKKLLRGFLNKITLLLIPLIVALVGKVLGYSLVWVVDTTIKIIVLSEIMSALGHIQYIRTGERGENQDTITKLINAIKNKINSTINKLIVLDDTTEPKE